MKKDFIRNVQLDVLNEQKQKDGISQIVTGFSLVILSAFLLIGKPNMFVVLIPILPTLLERLRKIYTYPRIGFADVGDRKALRKVMLVFFIPIILIAFGVMMYFCNKTLDPNQQNLLNLAVSVGIAFVIIILLLYRYQREHNQALLFYIAALIAVVAVVRIGKLHIRDVVPIILGLGLLDFSIGLVLLQRFVRKYPVLQDEN